MSTVLAVESHRERPRSPLGLSAPCGVDPRHNHGDPPSRVDSLERRHAFKKQPRSRLSRPHRCSTLVPLTNFVPLASRPLMKPTHPTLNTSKTLQASPAVSTHRQSTRPPTARIRATAYRPHAASTRANPAFTPSPHVSTPQTVNPRPAARPNPFRVSTPQTVNSRPLPTGACRSPPVVDAPSVRGCQARACRLRR